MRCEMSQKAMSLLPRERRNRRPMVWASRKNTASAETTATSHGTPRAMAMNSPAMQPMNKPMMPSRGR